MTTTITQTARPVSSSPFAASSPVQRKTMSITQTYFLAHKARSKLSTQAARPDHDLRLLVGHANLLDTLMLELADAEREQESWFNQSVRGAQQQKDRHVQWADSVIEEPEEDWHAEDADDDSDEASDSSSDFDSDEDDEEDEDEDSSEDSLGEDDIDMADAVPLRRVASHQEQAAKPVITVVKEVDDSSSDEEVDDDEEDYEQLTLTRSPSHSALPSARSPPELVISEDSDEASDDESSMPPSPPTLTIPSFDKKAEQQQEHNSTTTTSTHASQQEFDVNDRCYLPPRNPARLVSAISVY